MSSSTLLLAEQLIARPSVTPEDAGCLQLLAERLQPLGFDCERMDSGPDGARVSNLWAKRPAAPTGIAQEAIKTIVFAGHTDVVPTGPLAQWSSPPFTPTQRDGSLYGRGASDMKTSIAAFVVAVEEFLQNTPEPLRHAGGHHGAAAGAALGAHANQSAALMASRLWLVATVVVPAPCSRCSTLGSRSMPAKCRPVVSCRC